VREYVATRRREIRIEAGREPAATFIPQEHLPGREAEVDFGDVAIRLRGELVTCALFSLRLSYSGKAVQRISASAGQEAFFEGHAHAFRVLGGVPVGKIGSAEGLVDSGVYAARATASCLTASHSTGVSLPSRRCRRRRW